MEWAKLFYVLGALLAGYFVYTRIRQDRQAFAKHNLMKSLSTLGVLALLLIGFIALSVMLLKAG